LVDVAERVRVRLAGAIRVGRGEVAEPPQPGLVRPAKRLAAREIQCAEGVAVVAPPPAEDDPAARVAARQVAGADELQRGPPQLGGGWHRGPGRRCALSSRGT